MTKDREGWGVRKFESVVEVRGQQKIESKLKPNRNQ